jgi:hypothetical protein
MRDGVAQIMNNTWDTRKPIESFFPRLATSDKLRVALRKKFGRGTAAIITKLKTGQPLVDDELEAHDIILDLVGNESDVIKILYRIGDVEKEYSICIMRFATGRRRYVYWIVPYQEDEAGYFGSIKSAEEYADIMYVI